MTNCNSQRFPSTCQESTIIKTFNNTGEVIRYQEIVLDPNLVDGVVLITENGKYYKAIYTENTINIEWYRCMYPTDLTNGTGDKVMLTKAINTAGHLGAILRFDAKEYIINEQLSFQSISCFKLLGDKQHTVIKSDTGTRFPGYYFSFTSCNNFIIDGIGFDQNKRNIAENYSQSDYPNDYNGGIFITFCSNLEICNSHFYDLYTRAITIYDCRVEGDVIKVNNNYFESEVQNQKYRMEHLVFGQCQQAHFIIENNIFKNEPPRDEKGNPLMPDPAKMPSGIGGYDCGYWGSVLVNNNVFEYCGRNNDGEHRLFAIDFYDNVNNFIISNNIFRNTTWGAIRFDGTKKNAVINDNYIHQLISNDSGIINASARIVKEVYENSFKNISICNNIIEGVVGDSYGIGLQSQEDTVTAENISILNNTFSHLRTAVTIGGNLMGVNISNNNASDMSGPVIEYYAHSATITVVNSTTTITTPRLTAALGNTLISNNNFKASAEGNGFVGIVITGFTPASSDDYELVSSLTKRFVVSNNLIFGNGRGYGVTINVGVSLAGKTTVSANEVSNLQTGLYIRVKDTMVRDNVLFNCSLDAIKLDSVTAIAFQNYYNNSPI